MCGIVAYVGPSGGLSHVLDALELLTYRAPDSSGVALLDAQGKMTVRRAVGTAQQLQRKLEEQPLPAPFQGELQVVAGHGRWAMVGAVTEINAHPICDRGRNRVICENGSHNASLMMAGLATQERWWRGQGVPEGEAVHRTSNSSEVLVLEWERQALELAGKRPASGDRTFLRALDRAGIQDLEERALRLALWRFRQGNAHACAFYSCLRPDTLYISSHNKPIALAMRNEASGRRSLMAASDVNAALMLWPKEEVAAVEASLQRKELTREEQRELQRKFGLSVIFLDHHLAGGEELFARIEPELGEHGPQPKVTVTRYDGQPIVAPEQWLFLSPMTSGPQLHDSFTESHIAEIPGVMIAVSENYIREDRVHLEAGWLHAELEAPGLNVPQLELRFGQHLERLRHLRLIGEGSSWRNALAAAPLFRRLLPGVLVTIHRPVEMLNLGLPVEPAIDLAVEISWSGTTDSLLKVDKWLAGLGVLRVAVTGRPQSDLGRRTNGSGGTINVLTGLELSVATVKGYQAILMVLDLLALQLADLGPGKGQTELAAVLIQQLGSELPRLVGQLIDNVSRRRRLRHLGRRCAGYNKFVVVGDSPIVVEAELKIEELAQVLACAADFDDASLRPLIERSARSNLDEQRVLFIVNATSEEGIARSRSLVRLLKDNGLFFLLHTSAQPDLTEFQLDDKDALILSPAVSPLLQPLIDAPFFFELAVALAYGRGLSSAQVDRPRNLAKSVTTTSAEPRQEVEVRRDFESMTLSEFAATVATGEATRPAPLWPSEEKWNALISPLSAHCQPRLQVWADGEAVSNGVGLAGEAWRELTGVALKTTERKAEASLQLVTSGSRLAWSDEQVLALPAGLRPLEIEWLTAVCLMRLALSIAPIMAPQAALWRAALARLPQMLSQLSEDLALSGRIRADLAPLVRAGYDKMQIIGGGQDHEAARCIARNVRAAGFMAEALYTDSAWHGPLAAVGGPNAEHDTMILVLATDPLFQAAALVDTQVYRARRANLFLVVTHGMEKLPAVQGVDALAVWSVPVAPRPFQALLNTALGGLLSRQLAQLWAAR